MNNYKSVKAKENVCLMKLYEQREVCKKLEHHLNILFVWCFGRNELQYRLIKLHNKG